MIKIILPPQFESLRRGNKIQTEHFRFYSMPPYGMSVVTAALRQQGYRVEPVDCAAFINTDDISEFLYLFDYWQDVGSIIQTGYLKDSSKINDLLDRCLEKSCLSTAQIVGFSIPTFGHFLFALLLARRLRDKSDVPIIFGGAFITIFGGLYEHVLAYVDYMLMGDAFQVLYGLVEAILNKNSLISTISNITYRKNNQIIRNEFKAYPLKDMPMPDFEGLDLSIYKKQGVLTLPYQLSRSCRHGCAFCIQNPVDYAYETKPADQVIREWKTLIKKYDCRDFQLCDSNLGNDRHYLVQLLDQLIAADLGITWRCYMGIVDVDQEILLKLKQAGCDALMYGVETGSDRMLKMINKNQTAKQIENVLQLTKQCGIETSVSLMSGYPYENDNDVEQSVKFLERNKKNIDYCVIRTFTVIYGTAMQRFPQKYGLCNLTQMDSLFMYSYDEINGLAWNERTKKQGNSKERIARVLLDQGY